MAVVDSQFLAGVLTQFRGIYRREFSGAQALQGWQRFALRQDAPGLAQTTYEWFGTVPKMQDVSHDVVAIRGLDEYNLTIVNKEWQAAIEVSRMSLERDQLGLITPRIAQLAGEAARHPGELIFSIVEDNPDAYDGTAFFSDTRVIGESANIDNIVAGDGVTTVALIQADLAEARGRMRTFQDDRGRELNMVGNAIMIPAHLELIMWQALNPGSAGNLDRAVLPVTQNGIWTAAGYAVIVNPFLSGNDWYLFHLGGGTMVPFIWQVEKMPVLESDTDPNTRDNIIKRNFLYSVYGRYNVGVTDPRLGVKIDNS